MAVLAIAAAMAVCLPASAGVTSDTSYRSYNVGGTTERGIVRYMRQHPFRGDNGHAYANLKHRHTLRVETEKDGPICRATEVNLDIDFTMTLPKSSNPKALSASARRSFDGFVNFAKKHEEHHRASFIACGKSFVSKALRLRAAQCATLISDIKALLKKSDAACEAGERGFDRQQSRAVNGLALFRNGR